MIRSLLSNRRFISFIKYRKYIKRKPRKVVRLLKKKFKNVLFKDVKKKIFFSLLFRNPTKKINHVPRSYFFKYRVPFNAFANNVLYLYFSVPDMSFCHYDQFSNFRLGDRIFMHVSRHLNLGDISFFDDFFDDFYFGVLVRLNKNETSPSLTLQQYAYDVSVKHKFYAHAPNIILLERVPVNYEQI
jgi:ribosomal protein L19